MIFNKNCSILISDAGICQQWGTLVVKELCHIPTVEHEELRLTHTIAQPRAQAGGQVLIRHVFLNRFLPNLPLLHL